MKKIKYKGDLRKEAYSRGGVYVSGQKLKQASSDTEQKTTKQNGKKPSHK